jgi:hypothetical protein
MRQSLVTKTIDDVATAIAGEFARSEIRETIQPGKRVALTAGSRGIDRIDQVLKAVAGEVRQLGAEPFIVPAMGSHGGATAEGQLEILAHYGVTEEAMGCPIRSSMDTVLLGHVEDNVPVWFDKTAYTQADITIPIGRVKPHTDFHGHIESGLMKMLAIGLGKQKGADTFHARSFAEFPTLIPAVGQFTLKNVGIPFGLALVEDGHSRLSLVRAVPAERILDEEQELLEIARERMPRLPGEMIDVLIVDQIGKDISGIGADTNVINRYWSGPLPQKPHIRRVIMRDLTPDTEGNACGIGLGDVALKQIVDKLDPVQTYMNVITAKGPEGARIPITVANDREAVFVALACCHQTENETARIMRIQDTKHLEDLWVSEPLVPQMEATGRVQQVGEFEEMSFDSRGMFTQATRNDAAVAAS